jgi:hypothetical protein
VKTVTTRALRISAVAVIAVATLSCFSDDPRPTEPATFSASQQPGGPAIASIEPAHGPTAGGDLVTIAGDRLWDGGNLPIVHFGPRAATVEAHTPTALVVRAPEGEGLVDVTVQTTRGVSNALAFRYDAPEIAELVPAGGAAAGGETVALDGVNFGLSPTVHFGSAAATIDAAQSGHKRLVVTSPAGVPGSTVLVRVTVAGLESNARHFTYDGPVVSGLTPSHGPTAGGTTLTIHGSGFGAVPPSVTLGGTPAEVIEVQPARIVVLTPPGEGHVAAQVRAGAGISPVTEASHFTYDAPELDLVTPAGGPAAGGTALTLTGSNFGLAPTVAIGDAVVVPVKGSASHTGIVVHTPPGAPGAAVPVRVTVAGSSSNARQFVYEGPAITTITPATGPTPGGTLVTITGRSFGDAAPTVQFGTSVIKPESFEPETTNPARVVFRTPDGQGTVAVRVQAGAAVSAPADFTYDEPRLEEITPTTGSAAGGTALTLTGQNFGLTPVVRVGGAVAPVVSSNAAHTSLVVQTPAGTPGATVPVQVTVAGHASEERPFTYAGPGLTHMTPANGPTAGGVLITISGSNFGTAEPAVRFGDATARVVGHSATQIIAESPPGQGQVQVRVSAGGAASNTLTFHYQAPEVHAVSPASAPSAGGTTITLLGANFGLEPVVTIGGLPADLLLPATHTQLRVRAPEGAPGSSVPVLVTVAGQQSNERPFAYAPPDIAGMHPANGPTGGGTPVTIVGTSFGAAAPTVWFGSTPATVDSHTHTRVVVTAPAGQGAVDVTVQAGAALSASSASFTYDGPALHAIHPTSGPAAGGTLLTITGTNFGVQPQVTIGGVVATPAGDGSNHTQIVVATPPGAAGTQVPVRVNVAGRESNAVDFVYDPVVHATAMTPANGPTAGGTSITITGSGFGSTTPAVTFGGSAAEIVSSSATHVVARSPQGEGVVPVVVAASGVQSNALWFGYDAPVLNSHTPGGGLPGETVVIAGSNFGLDPVVTFGTRQAAVIQRSHVQLSVEAPAGVGPQPIRVTVAGQTSNALVFNYALCGPGTYQDADECVPAPPGHFVAVSGATAATPCAAGTYQPAAGQTACIPAPAGTFVAAAGSVVATDCPAGSFQPNTGQPDCIPAPAGHFVAMPGAAAAEPCPAGRFQPGTGASSCVPAPAGSFVASAGATAALPCTPGTYQPAMGAIACILSPAGSFVAAAAAAAAVPCPLGHFQAEAGQTSCVPAPPGHFVGTAGALAATRCEPGTYQPNAGAGECLPAPAGSFVSGPGATAPLPCDAGSFQPEAGQAACINAPAGRFVAESGATAATPCAVGTFQPATGASTCLSAPPGRFVPGPGATAALPCAAGTFQPGTGQASCMPAPAGSFVPTVGATAAIPCAPGTYQSAVGAIACRPADAGHFVAAPGATAPTPCAAGRYQPASGETACLAAPRGTFVADIGAVAATLCAVGTFQPEIGQTACPLAPIGSYVPAPGAVSATPCPEGTTTMAPGATSLAQCVTAMRALVLHAEEAAARGDLRGTGSGQIAERRLRDWLDLLRTAESQLGAGNTGAGCSSLDRAYATIDDSSAPPPTVTGPAAPVLRALIDDARTANRCN